MELFAVKKDCCGCGACKAVCSQNAINMIEDDKGFRYPEIDKIKCVQCGACQRVCPIKELCELNESMEAYAATNKDVRQRMMSASGGVFSAIATKALELGWQIWGAAFVFKHDGMVDVVHRAVNRIDDLSLLQGSKYVQSCTDDVYMTLKEELINHRKVLFSGTPCQVQALKKSVGKNTEGLFTVDIICHGVPSVKMFNDYLSAVFGKEKQKICFFSFRDKYSGWGMTALAKIQDTKGRVRTQRISSKNSSFFSFFLQSKIYRESCYSCPYARGERVGDLTIGDYWGIKEVHPELLSREEFAEEKGISCILVNTEKGRALLNELGESINTVRSMPEFVKKENYQLQHPSIKPNDYDQIQKEYTEKGFSGFETELRKQLGYKYWVNNVVVMIPASVKKIIKSLLKK